MEWWAACSRGRVSGRYLPLLYVLALALWMAMLYLQVLLIEIQHTEARGDDTRLEHLRGCSEKTSHGQLAIIRMDLMGLRNLLTHPCPGIPFHWMRLRVSQMWLSWRRGAEQLLKNKLIASGRRKKNILLHFGTLARGNRLDETAFNGGPLGELVQWSDLVATLYVLGHDITITTEISQLEKLLSEGLEQFKKGNGMLPYDLIYTDIHGYKQFRNTVPKGVFTHSKCLFRILDSFGTEAEFNFEPYVRRYHDNNKSEPCEWGCLHLRLQQFYTMFPHTPDNSFLGFVVQSADVEDRNKSITKRRPNQALVYAKKEYMWQGKKEYIDVVSEFFDIHATTDLKVPRVGTRAAVPEYVHNHYVLHGASYKALLQQSKVFVGLGFPYEGPAPLEAIGSGAVFINPKFSPPHSRANTEFFAGKPTHREVTSQHPYAESLGEPYVYTVDLSNHSQLREVLGKLQSQSQVSPYIPFEFTAAGILQRMSYYIENQDFCTPPIRSHVPSHAIQVIASAKGKSCNDACRSLNLVCESSHFGSNNKRHVFREHSVTCTETVIEEGLVYPSFTHSDKIFCFLQQNEMLLNCASKHERHSRLCPCRTFKKEQVALCNEC